jgi:tetratricopeptide (TPR) repeat protein
MHSERGEYNDALACFRESESISLELGDRRVYASTIGNRGNVHADLGEYEKALACYREQESIAQKIGDRLLYSGAVGNRGLVHADLGEYEKALACHREQETISREIGNRLTYSIAVGNRGMVHKDRGEYEEALACFREQESISLELENRLGCAEAVGKSAGVLVRQSEFEEALARYTTALEDHTDIGYRYGATNWLEGIAGILVTLTELESNPPNYLGEYVPDLTGADWRKVCLDRARDRASECLQISSELRKPDTLFSSRVLLARIDAATGKRTAAIEALLKLLEDVEGHAQRAEILYRLSEIDSSASARQQHAEKALALYTELWSKTPNHEFRERIDELNAR